MSRNSISKSIQQQEWLEPVARGLQKFVQQAFRGSGCGGQKIKNFLHGTWLGHPLHVIITDVPIGGWTVALVLDALEVATGQAAFGKAADAAITVGLVGAAGSAVTGLTDFQDIDAPASRIGAAHGLLNVGAASLYLASRISRKKGARSTGRALAAIGYAIAAGSAYLGGSLVYEEGIGVDRNVGEQFPKDFVPVLPESELGEGQLKRVQHDGVPILVVRRGDQILAVAETCSHLGGPLSEGKLEGTSVQCPWHASRFALEDGRVLDGPAVHPLPCMETQINNGQVEIRRRPTE